MAVPAALPGEAGKGMWVPSSPSSFPSASSRLSGKKGAGAAAGLRASVGSVVQGRRHAASLWLWEGWVLQCGNVVLPLSIGLAGPQKSVLQSGFAAVAVKDGELEITWTWKS